jgi:hypothetical protein
MAINVIFPMAGLGSRFDYQFKPFIYATEYRFIELAKQPFDQLQHKHFYFIVRESQEKEYHVTDTLHSLFPNDSITICIVTDTDGPLQTLQQAIQKYKLSGASFICDCDHSIDIQPMLEVELSGQDVVVPTWNIQPVDYPNWGKVSVLEDGSFHFYEKELIIGKDVRGLIGCYLFRAVEMLLDFPAYQNISDVLKLVKRIRLVPITKADFFGTPYLLQQFRYQRAQKYTLFIDIDGTLIHQTTKQVLPHTIDQLTRWRKAGHRIVLTTACVASKMVPHLTHIPYDEILYNLTPGPRYVINDRKPYNPTYTMADGISLERNYGIGDIRLPDVFPNIVKALKGGSKCQTYLLDTGCVRKFAIGTEREVLKRQYEDMKRFQFYFPGICPALLGEHHGATDYYYDMEYLEHYQTLSHFPDETVYKVILTVLKDLHDHVYCYKKVLKPVEKKPWVDLFMAEKVYPRLSLLLPFDTLIINGVSYLGIQKAIEKVNLEDMAPDYICPIHGDLTLENIMYDGTHYKLIDLAGSRYMDAHEQDVGKVLQSLVCKYAEWDPETEVVVLGQNTFQIPEKYLFNKQCFPNYKVCVFYMCMHLIRMVPFLMHKSEKHRIFVQLLAAHYLKSLIH